jgi:hypothetical protein
MGFTLFGMDVTGCGKFFAAPSDYAVITHTQSTRILKRLAKWIQLRRSRSLMDSRIPESFANMKKVENSAEKIVYPPFGTSS